MSMLAFPPKKVERICKSVNANTCRGPVAIKTTLVNSNLDSEAALTQSTVPSSIIQTCVADVLASPEFGPHLQNIRKLWWDSDVDGDSRLILLLFTIWNIYASSFLEKRLKIITLPSLPQLKSVEVTLEYEWMIPVYNRFLAILTAAPDTLEEICIKFAPKPHFLYPEALGRMDDILMGSAPSPRVRRRLELKDNLISSFDGFVGALKRGLSILHARGKLIVG
ncbi:hypothetical protein DFH08DRAFT_824571 [Mycena albidolilacea]|uniref:Uncharacterized protein n=1 Tax=Mycena albidolilacea TaxID=1033008 RepID=A0AAD6Z4K5_9AGAR|nr:hypothetical protein DFH08DRAFT_824571 [Mycena albidolilacea]